MATRREFFRYRILDDDDTEILTATSDPSGENPVLHVPDMPVRNVRIFEGTSSISSLVVRILDKRIVPSDQASGFVTAAMKGYWAPTQEAYNRLLRKRAELYRRFDDEPEELVYRGTVSGIRLRQATTLEISHKDARASEKVRIWETGYAHPLTADSTEQPIAQPGAVLFHRYSHLYGATWGDWRGGIWGGATGIGRPSRIDWWVDAKVRVKDNAHWIELWDGAPNMSEGHPVLTSGSVEEWAGRAQIIVARQAGGQWVFSNPITLAGSVYEQRDYSHIIGVEGELLGSEWLSVGSPPGWDRRVVIRAAGPVSDDNPILVGGNSGIHPITLLRLIWDGHFTAPVPDGQGGYVQHRVDYDEVEIARLENDLDPVTGEPLAMGFPKVWFRLTETAELIEWIEDNILAPFSLWPVITSEGKVSLRSLLRPPLPANVTPPLRLEKQHIIDAHWAQDLGRALNVVDYKIQVAIPGAKSPDGLRIVTPSLQFAHESVEVLGRQGGQEIQAKGVWTPAAQSDQQHELFVDAFVRPWLEPHAHAKFALGGWGMYEISVTVPKRIGAALEPYRVREGDEIELAYDAIPDFESGRRGLSSRFVVLSQRERRNAVELKLVWRPPPQQ